MRGGITRERVDEPCRLGADHRPENDVTLPRIADRQTLDARFQPGDERIGNRRLDDHALGGHADLALVHVRAEDHRIHRRAEIRVVEHHHGRLAAQFQEDRLQMAAGGLGDDAADARRSREVHTTHGRVRDEGADDRRGIRRCVRDDIDRAGRQTRFLEHGADERVRRRTDLGRLEHDRISTCKRRRDGAHAKDDRSVPRRNPEHDSRGLSNRERVAAWLVRGDDFAGDLRRERGRLSQHAGGEHHVEAGPSSGAAGFACHDLDELGRSCRQQVGGLQQDHPPFGRALRGPDGKRGGGRIGRPQRVGNRRGGRRVDTSPLIGFRRSNVAPPSAGSSLPAIRSAVCIGRRFDHRIGRYTRPNAPVQRAAPVSRTFRRNWRLTREYLPD